MHTAAPRTNNMINAITDKEYTYYVTLRYVGIMNLGRKGIKLYIFLVCVYRLNYEVRNNQRMTKATH